VEDIPSGVYFLKILNEHNIVLGMEKVVVSN